MTSSDGTNDQQPKLDPSDPSRRARLKGKGKVLDRRFTETQMTAEQLLREAKELHKRGGHHPQESVTAKILSGAPSEQVLKDQQAHKRFLFERRLKKQHHDLSLWIYYAQWEEKQGFLVAARSIFERCQQHLEFVYRMELWRAYSAMEQRAGQLGPARNVLERAVSAIPSEQLLWLDYVLLLLFVNDMEEVRNLSNRWLSHTPPPAAWEFCVRCELLYGSIEQARSILSRYPVAYNTLRTWMFYSQIEFTLSDFSRASAVMKAATAALSEHDVQSVPFQKQWNRILLSAGRIDEARDVLDNIIQSVTIRQDLEALADIRETLEVLYGTPSTRRHVFYTLTKQKLELLDIATTPLDVLLQELRDAVLRVSKGARDEMSTIERHFAVALFGSESEFNGWIHHISSNPTACDHLQAEFISKLCEEFSFFLEQFKGDEKQAASVLLRAIELFPKNVADRLWIALAKLHGRQDSIIGAREAFSKGSSWFPTISLFKEWIQFEAELVKRTDGKTQHLSLVVDNFIEFSPTEAYATVPSIICEALTSFSTKLALEFTEAILRRLLTDDRVSCCNSICGLTLLKLRLEQGNIKGCLEVYKRMIQQKTQEVSACLSSAERADMIQELVDLIELLLRFGETMIDQNPEANAMVGETIDECLNKLSGLATKELSPISELCKKFKITQPLSQS